MAQGGGDGGSVDDGDGDQKNMAHNSGDGGSVDDGDRVLDAFRRLVIKGDVLDREHRSLLGALLSLAVLGAFAVYVYEVIIGFVTSPPPQDVNMLWTSMQGPVALGPQFPIDLRCTHQQGCTFTWHFSGASARSRACSQAVNASGMCFAVGYMDVLANATLCYSDLPFDGLYAFHGADGATPSGVSVDGVTELPHLMSLSTPLHAGRNELHHVLTRNFTYREGDTGHLRREFFPTLLSPDFDPVAVRAACFAVADNVSAATLLTLGAAWTEITVPTRYHQAFAIYGECGGALSLLLEFATSALAVLALSGQLSDRTAKLVRVVSAKRFTEGKAVRSHSTADGATGGVAPSSSISPQVASEL